MITQSRKYIDNDINNNNVSSHNSFAKAIKIKRNLTPKH